MLWLDPAKLVTADVDGPHELYPGTMVRRRHNDSLLFVIGIYKALTGVLFGAAAIGVTQLFHKNVEAKVEQWLDLLKIDPDNRYVGGFLDRLHMIHTKELKGLAAFGVFYSVLFLTEGTGLLLGQRWAEWLTVVATSMFLPLEIYEIASGISAANVALFVVNAAIVAALIYKLRAKS
jgi:uncharacterized membrane protein (DUF2068 family)